MMPRATTTATATIIIVRRRSARGWSRCIFSISSRRASFWDFPTVFVFPVRRWYTTGTTSDGRAPGRVYAVSLRTPREGRLPGPERDLRGSGGAGHAHAVPLGVQQHGQP